MGVAQSFYAPLASWLAAQGFLAATFDLRGIGLFFRPRFQESLWRAHLLPELR